MKKFIFFFIALLSISTVPVYASTIESIFSNGKTIFIQILIALFACAGAYFSFTSFVKRNIPAAIGWLLLSIVLAIMVSNPSKIESLINELLRTLGLV